MGKIESKAFCFFHNMKNQMFGGYSSEQLMNLNCNLAGVYASNVADENPDFEKADALYAFSAAMRGEGEAHYATYAPYFEKYDNDLNKVISDLMPSLENWLQNSPEFNQKAHGLLAFLYIARGNTEKGNEILDLFLQQEERGMDIEPGVWISLCALSNFEKWHDDKYGNPIIGNAPNHTNSTSGSTPAPDRRWAADSRSGGCYIATAVYGSYDCPEVWVLRRFRDHDLSESWYGRIFIHMYYAISPMLVRWFGESKWFQRFWRGKLDAIVSKLQDQGYENSPYQDKIWR